MQLDLRKRARREGGYVLLTLMLFVALLTIGLLALVQNIESQIKRDREEEMIHRGVQYSRAVRLFYVKFGRFPASVEELENTNNIRFLRKRYKDPITGKDFKPLHMNEVAVFQQAGRVPAPAAAVQPQDSNDGSKNVGAVPGEAEVNPADAAAADAEQQRKPDPVAADSSEAGDPEGAEAAAKLNAQESEANSAPPVLGVPIVGVVSLSRSTTIREFNGKDHYNQWLFIFNPTYSTAGLINTPDQPPLQRASQALPNENPGPRASQVRSNGGAAPGSRPPDR